MHNPTANRATEVTGIAPQLLVDDLFVAIEYYRDKLGFATDFVHESFYASVSRDGCSIHLKSAPETVAFGPTVAGRTPRREHPRTRIES